MAFKYNLSSLPNLFFEENKQTIKYKFVKEIFHVDTTPSKKIKNLLKKFESDKTTKQDMFVLLSNKMVSGDFRQHWYDLCEANNGGGLIAPLNFLTSNFITRTNPDFDVDSELFSQCFSYTRVKKRKKYFPKPEMLEEIIDNAISNKQVGIVFIWVLIENIEYALYRGERDDRLVSFKENVFKLLAAKSAFDVIDQLMPNTLYNDIPLKENVSLQETLPTIVAHDTDIVVIENKNPLSEDFKEAINILQDCYENIKASVKIINAKNNTILTSSHSEQNIEMITLQLSNIKEDLNTSNKKLHDLHLKVNEFTKRHLSLLGFSFSINLPSCTSINTIPKSVIELKSFENESIKSFIDLVKINNSPHITEFQNKGTDKSLQSFKAIELACEEILEEIVHYEKGIESLEKIKELINKKSKDVTWSLFNDTSNHQSDLLNAFRYKCLKLQFDDILFVSASKLGNDVNDEICTLIERKIFNVTLINLIEAITFINFLPLQVSDDLECKSHLIRPIICLSHIHLALQSKISIEDKQILINSKAVIEFKSGSNKALSNFLKELTQLISNNTFRNGYSFLARKINLLKNNNEKTNLEDKYIKDLKSILTFYNKGGGTTYSHIWSEAYKDIFAPLLELVESKNLTSFIDLFETITNNLDLEYRLVSWKTNIPEHLKKRSEYNKNIKNAVRTKLEEIQSYIEENNFFLNDSKKDKLNNFIEEVLTDKNPDSKFFQLWLNNIIHFEKSVSSYSLLRKLTFGPLDIPFDKIPSKFIRTSIKVIKGQEINNDDLLNDSLINFFQDTSPTSLAQHFFDNDVLEGYSKLVNDIENEDINLDLERAIEKRIEDKIEHYDSLLKNLQHEINTIPEPERDIFITELGKLQDCIRQQQWHLLEKIYTDLKQTIDSYFLDEKENTIKKQLSARIFLLNGTHPSVKDYSLLVKEHEKLMESMSSRMLHIKQLERLKQTEVYKLNLEKVINDAIDFFYNKLPYPSVQQSHMISFTWQQALDPLILELSRIKTLLPSYSKKLLHLTETFIVNLIGSDSLHEKSLFNDMILSTSDTWNSLPSSGESGIEKINSSFIENNYEIVFSSNQDESKTLPDEQEKHSGDEIILIKDREKINETLITTKRRTQLYIIENINNNSPSLKDTLLSDFIKDNNWLGVYNSKPEIILDENNEKSFSDLHIVYWCISSMICMKTIFSIRQLSYICHLINKEKISFDNPKGKTLALNLVSYLINRICYESEPPFINEIKYDKQADLVSTLYNNIVNVDKYKDEFYLAFMNATKSTSFTLKNLWDSFTGDSKQAESRAYLMYTFWHLQSPELLGQCLSFPPIDLDSRKANALADIARRALIEKNNDLLQPLYDLKNSISSKPYAIFIDLIRKVAPVYTENPASFEFVGPLEYIGPKVLKGRFRISPRKNDSPDSIIITLPPKGPIRFENDKLKKEFLGPFLMDKIVPIELNVLLEGLEDFNIEIDVETFSITGNKNKYSAKLNLILTSEHRFSRISLDDIEDAFDSFPEQQMRGEDYVPRIEDEKKIEKSLIISKSIRSVWITSPRRSGKTTMLYWILDAYSHKADRDIIVMYFTLDEPFKTTIDFNKWLWRRLRTFPANKKLRSTYKDFDEIGKHLDFENDVGTFMSNLTDLLIDQSEMPSSINRVIFMFDEIDRFASMHFNSIEQKDTANDILWQIRTMISSSRNIGVVFAGSTAAKEIFIKHPASPFYNSIEHIELTPFSCKNQESEFNSRKIVEPLKFRGKFQLSKQSLEHLLWVCAGIPYYMKLLAGATYSVIRQGKIIESDINDGLYALLNKNTGISKLDGMGAAAGTDELRTTVTLENNQDGIIARAVLFTLAELYSPVSGHAVLRGKLTSNESKLIYEYRLTKKQINDGIDTCMKLGLIQAVYSENITKLSFSIPILGESIRFNSHRFWAEIHTELKEITTISGE